MCFHWKILRSGLVRVTPQHAPMCFISYAMKKDKCADFLQTDELGHGYQAHAKFQKWLFPFFVCGLISASISSNSTTRLPNNYMHVLSACTNYPFLFKILISQDFRILNCVWLHGSPHCSPGYPVALCCWHEEADQHSQASVPLCPPPPPNYQITNTHNHFKHLIKRETVACVK